jgi:hypothetical protein
MGGGLRVDLSQCRVGICRQLYCAACSPLGQKHLRQQPQNEQQSANSNNLEDGMTSAMQAFLLTAGLFGLSFLGIFFFWFAERLRYGSSRKLPR